MNDRAHSIVDALLAQAPVDDFMDSFNSEWHMRTHVDQSGEVACQCQYGAHGKPYTIWRPSLEGAEDLLRYLRWLEHRYPWVDPFNDHPILAPALKPEYERLKAAGQLPV